MELNAVIQQISLRDFWDFTADDIDLLARLPAADYAEVIRRLLLTPVRLAGLTGPGYRAAYRCRVTGCVLFTMRPQPALYEAVLHGALGIGDPTSIKHGAAALLYARPAPQVARDVVQAAIELQSSDWLDLVPPPPQFQPWDWLIHQSASLLYWIGLSPRSQPYRMLGLYRPPITALRIERARPISTPDEAAAVAQDTARYLLDQFEQHVEGPVARTSFALLTHLDPKQYPDDLAVRIIHAWKSARLSPDSFVRERVQSPDIQRLIAQNSKQKAP